MGCQNESTRKQFSERGKLHLYRFSAFTIPASVLLFWSTSSRRLRETPRMHTISLSPTWSPLTTYVLAAKTSLLQSPDDYRYTETSSFDVSLRKQAIETSCFPAFLLQSWNTSIYLNIPHRVYEYTDSMNNTHENKCQLAVLAENYHEIRRTPSTFSTFTSVLKPETGKYLDFPELDPMAVSRLPLPLLFPFLPVCVWSNLPVPVFRKLTLRNKSKHSCAVCWCSSTMSIPPFSYLSRFHQ